MSAEVEIVKTSLMQFLSEYSACDDLSFIDDVVVSYVCGVIEELASGDEEVDAVEMKDVISAYVPIFENISDNKVETWVKDMVKKSLEQEKNKNKVNKDVTLDAIVSSFAASSWTSSSTETSERFRRLSETSDSSERFHKLSETSDTSEEMTKVKDDDQYAEALNMLLEMFPTTCNIEAQHCLNVSGGVLEAATSLLLERQEQGTAIKIATIPKIMPKGAKPADDKAIRDSIVNRYGFVDHEEDRKEHRPVAPKWEGKKMVRYRDNKVVSLKGERYTEIKKEEAEDMKKTYVHLKPGKQYKFH